MASGFPFTEEDYSELLLGGVLDVFCWDSNEVGNKNKDKDSKYQDKDVNENNKTLTSNLFSFFKLSSTSTLSDSSSSFLNNPSLHSSSLLDLSFHSSSLSSSSPSLLSSLAFSSIITPLSLLDYWKPDSLNNNSEKTSTTISPSNYLDVFF
jgi:hypothetical protein